MWLQNQSEFSDPYYQEDLSRLNKEHQDDPSSCRGQNDSSFPSLTLFLYYWSFFNMLYFVIFLHFWKAFLILLTFCEDIHLHVISSFIKWFLFLKLCTCTLQNNQITSPSSKDQFNTQNWCWVMFSIVIKAYKFFRDVTTTSMVVI